MRKRWQLVAATAAILAGAGTIAAQEPGAGGRTRPGPGGQAEMRQQIEERFAARVQEELGLTDEQTKRMKDVVSKNFDRRRQLEGEERELRQALAGQLRPGVAADKDKVSRLTDQLLDLRIRFAQSFKEEARELGAFLDPVQRAQFLVMRERLQARIQRAREMRGGPGGPGMMRNGPGGRTPGGPGAPGMNASEPDNSAEDLLDPADAPPAGRRRP